MLNISIGHISTSSRTLFFLNGGHLGCTLVVQITSEHRGLFRFILADVGFFGHSFELVVLVEELDVDLLDGSILIINWLILILNLISICDSCLQKIVRVL